MRIGFDTRALLGRSWFGPGTGSVFAPAGVAGYVFNIINHLTQIDGENEYVLFFNSFKQADISLIKDIINRPNVSLKTFHIPNKIFDRSARFLSWPKIDSLLGGVDVFFSPHFNITPLSDKTRHVLTIHDISFEFYPEFYPLRKRFWHWTQNVRVACQRADHVIAVSNNTKQDLISKYGLVSEKISVIYSGANIKTSQRASEHDISSVKKSYSLPNNYILYLGTLEPRKNIETIIEAFNKLKQQYANDDEVKPLHLVIGGGKGWLYQRIYKTAKQAEFKKYIHFLNYFPEKDKPALISGAKLFLFPSYYEGFGFPPLESRIFGTSVITSANSSLTEIMSNNALLVDPYNINDLTQSIRQVLLNNIAISENTLNSQKDMQNYSWNDCAEQTLNILLSAGKVV